MRIWSNYIGHNAYRNTRIDGILYTLLPRAKAKPFFDSALNINIFSLINKHNK